jgi:hypothetical protein
MPGYFDFNKRVALITGASRGLGLAMAEALAEAGATVILNGRDADTLKVAAGRMRDRGLKAETSAFDVTDRHAADAMGKTARSRRDGYLPCIRRGVLHHCTTDRCRWRLECHHVTDIRAPGARVCQSFSRTCSSSVRANSIHEPVLLSKHLRKRQQVLPAFAGQPLCFIARPSGVRAIRSPSRHRHERRTCRAVLRYPRRPAERSTPHRRHRGLVGRT